ncbi:MAG TPA: signal peptidase II [Azospirillum sp.]|nr:signal peptidase II [Azospirillum sp.]
MQAFVASQRQSYFSLGLAVAAVVIVLDQVSKWWILEHVMQPPRVIEVTPFFNLVLAWNQGVSFGMFSHEAAVMPYVLSAVALVIVGALLAWLRGAERPLVALSIGMVIGGAIGNIIDRLRFGAVADFLDFHAFGWHFWAFNVADTGISVGVALLVLDGLLAGHDKA